MRTLDVLHRSYSRGTTVALAALLAGGLALSACGSSGSATATASVVKSACTKVNDALSDGPDPDADALGYAEAQVKPLFAIKTADAPLQRAITSLADAYQAYFRANGKSGTATVVKTSQSTINRLCKGYLS